MSLKTKTPYILRAALRFNFATFWVLEKAKSDFRISIAVGSSSSRF
jgi:hypothetical protein